MSERVFQYEGPAYIRPIGRGIVLESESGDVYLEEAIENMLSDSEYSMSGGAHVQIKVNVEIVEVHHG